MPFLTDIDSRAAVKGSRDPLGIQSIWTYFGRKLVGNLTYAASSVRDYTVTILGYHFARQAADAGCTDGDLAVFLKWEQLAAYARALTDRNATFRGIERVRKTLDEGSAVRLSADRAWQILANQKIYGLWGLYTVPATASSLLEGEPTRPTPTAMELIEKEYLPIFGKHGFKGGDAVVKLLSNKSPTIALEGSNATLVRAVAEILKTTFRDLERETFMAYLVHGGPGDPTNGLQKQFAELIRSTLDDEQFEFTPSTMRRLAEEARRAYGPDMRLSEWLERIRVCDSIVGLSSRTFAFLLSRDSTPLREVAAAMRDRWQGGVPTIDVEAVKEIKPELEAASASSNSAGRWLELARCFLTGHYEDVVRLLIEQNRYVMNYRGGSGPWISEELGRLRVRVRDETGELPSRSNLKSLWVFPYFLGALRSVIQQLGAG